MGCPHCADADRRPVSSSLACCATDAYTTQMLYEKSSTILKLSTLGRRANGKFKNGSDLTAVCNQFDSIRGDTPVLSLYERQPSRVPAGFGPFGTNTTSHVSEQSPNFVGSKLIMTSLSKQGSPRSRNPLSRHCVELIRTISSSLPWVLHRCCPQRHRATQATTQCSRYGKWCSRPPIKRSRRAVLQLPLWTLWLETLCHRDSCLLFLVFSWIYLDKGTRTSMDEKRLCVSWKISFSLVLTSLFFTVWEDLASLK